MLYLPVVLFGIAAVGGTTLLVMIRRGAAPPMWLVIAHGAFATAGLVTLGAVAVSGGATPLMIVATVLFIAVALGGGALLSFQVMDKTHPPFLLFAHGIGAAVTYAILIIATASA